MENPSQPPAVTEWKLWVWFNGEWLWYTLESDMAPLFFEMRLMPAQQIIQIPLVHVGYQAKVAYYKDYDDRNTYRKVPFRSQIQSEDSGPSGGDAGE